MNGTATAHACELTQDDERRLHDLERTVFGNGRPGLVEAHAKLSGYLKGCAAVGTIVLAIILLLLTFILTSISDLEHGLRQRGAISEEHYQTQQQMSSDTSIR